MSEERRSDVGSNGNPSVGCDENVDMTETPEGNSDSERETHSDIDTAGMHEALTTFLCNHDLPFDLILDEDFHNGFYKLIYLKDVLKCDVAQLRDFTAILFCKHAFPPKAIKDGLFREFLKIRISETTLRKKCLDVYKQKKAALRELIESMDGRVSVSIEALAHAGRGFDMVFRQSYSSGPQYLCLKVHFIDDSWKRKNLVLDFYRHWMCGGPYPETAVKKSLSDWGIEAKLSTLMITLSDFCTAEIFQAVEDQISMKGELQLNSRLFRVFSCADLLNRMVQDAFDEIHSEIGDINLISCWLKSQPLWYHTVRNLKQALDFESEGEFEKDDYKNFKVPPPAGWKKVRAVHKLVETVYSVAKTLFDTKLSTAPMFYVGLLELQSNLMAEAESSDDFVSKLADKMLGKLKEYWSGMSLVLSIATIMDPRCKLKFVEFSLSKFKPGDQSSEIAAVKEALQSLYTEYAARTDSEREYPRSDLSSDSDEEAEEKEDGEEGENMQKEMGKKIKPVDIFKWANEYEQFISIDNQAKKSELVAYLEEPVLPWSNNFSALSWWRGAGHQYPMLSKMAREFLAIPLSHATSYEAYSTCERQIDDHVRRIDREMKIPLMCTQNWWLDKKREADPVAAMLFGNRT